MTYNDVRNIAELLYFFSGIVLVIVSIIALRQLSISRTDINIRVKRESATETARQCDRFAEELIPAFYKMRASFKEINIPIYKNKIKEFNINQEPEVKQWLEEFFSKKLHDTPSMLEVYKLLNSLESFSIYFIHGICDEAIAYNPLSNIFCEMVEAFYPYICWNRTIDSNSFECIIDLYKIWKTKKEQQNLNEKSSTLMEHIMELQEQASAIETPPLKAPIGLEKSKP